MSYPYPSGRPAAPGASSSTAAGDDRLRQTQNEVDAVVGLMKSNVEKVLDRDAKLSEIQEKSEALRDGAQRFKTHSTRLKRKMWWKNIKFLIIIFIVLALLITAIVIWIVKK